MPFGVGAEKQVFPHYEPSQRGNRRNFRRIHTPQQNRAYLFRRIGGDQLPVPPARLAPAPANNRVPACALGQAVCSPAKTSTSARLFYPAVERAVYAEVAAGERRVRQHRKRKTRRRVPAPVKHLQAELCPFAIMLFSPLLPVPPYGEPVLQSLLDTRLSLSRLASTVKWSCFFHSTTRRVSYLFLSLDTRFSINAAVSALNSGLYIRRLIPFLLIFPSPYFIFPAYLFVYRRG
jgi:hypothetical protein